MKLSPGIKIEFAFGVELDKRKFKLSPEWVSIGLNRIIKQATILFGGCTVVETSGDWIDGAGVHCRESGRTLSVCISGYNSVDFALAATLSQVEELINCVKHELDQEAVCVTVNLVRTAIL